MLSDPAETAFGNRGLDLEVATRLGAKFSNGKFSFAYTESGKHLFTKMRTPSKEFWIDPKGSRLQFWNLDAVRGLPSRPDEPLVITEGEFDCIAVSQACGGYVISVPNGIAGNRTESNIAIADDARFAYMWANERLIPELAQFDKIILAVDSDEPGQILRDELSLRIGDAKCWHVVYPGGCKDANDVLLKYGAETLRKLVQAAKPIRPGHLMVPSEILPRSREIAYSTGWKFLDAHIQLVRPEFMVVTGMPGHGKGQFIRALALNLARAHDWRTAFLAPEDPAHRIKRDLFRYGSHLFCENGAVPTPAQREAIKKWVDDHFRISQPPEDEPITLAMLEHEMEVAALHHGCQMFVVDPWNEVDHQMQRGDTTDTYIERCLRQLKRKMRRLGLVLVISAHPTKLSNDQVPSLYSISGSANWRNKAEHGVIVHREDPESNRVKIIVEKSKDWETTGKPGECLLEFNRLLCDYQLA
jgi:twinkle protein